MPYNSEWPAFCCAMLVAPDGRYLLEKRPREGRRRAGQLTCFGGSREPRCPEDPAREETPEECLVRELREELGWSIDPASAHRAVSLVNDGRELTFRVGWRVPRNGLIAWFYRAPAPPEGTKLVTEPGHSAVWLTREEIAKADMSSWHRAVFEAEWAGLNEARASR